MRAMMLEAARTSLRAVEVETPVPGPGQVRLKVEACAVCRTDLHIVDGELANPKLPLILGHQIVGRVDAVGPLPAEAASESAPGIAPAAQDVATPVQRRPLAVGDRVGVPWLGWSDGTCPYCLTGRENLCDHAKFTGYDIDGGYAEFAVADQRFAFPIPEGYPSLQAAPLLCAGLIGYRSLTMARGGRVTGAGQRLGIYGFGAAAHIVTQVARHQGRRVFAFTKPGDAQSQDFARHMGAEWAGATNESPPEELDTAIIFAPAGDLVPLALRSLAKGGVVVCAGIHMSDIPSFPYEPLWGERAIRSVANLTRRDAHEFLALAPEVPVRTEVQEFALEEANEALDALRRGKIDGAAVLVTDAGLAAKGG
jgi:alcohol dehydrogenase, propanol-preferring